MTETIDKLERGDFLWIREDVQPFDDAKHKWEVLLVKETAANSLCNPGEVLLERLTASIPPLLSDTWQHRVLYTQAEIKKFLIGKISRQEAIAISYMYKGYINEEMRKALE
jgi:hypothetical protein